RRGQQQKSQHGNKVSYQIGATSKKVGKAVMNDSTSRRYLMRSKTDDAAELIGSGDTASIAHLGFDIIQGDSHQPYDTACRDQSTGKQRPRTDFTLFGTTAAGRRSTALHHPAHHSPNEHGESCGNRDIKANRKRKRANPQQFDSDDYAHTQ